MKKFIYGVMMLSLCLLTACGSKARTPEAGNRTAEQPEAEPPQQSFSSVCLDGWGSVTNEYEKENLALLAQLDDL